MSGSKDYYAILGVLPRAEDVVIRAAYRALAQKYHPDKNSDASAETNRKLQEINGAYSVLSDAVRRKEYDDARRQAHDSDSFDPNTDEDVRSAFEDAEKENLERWRVAVDYYPDLDGIEVELRRTSHRLAFAFRAMLLESKEFEQRHDLAQKLERQFLETYFGRNEAVLVFAKKLITLGERTAARELNKVVSVLGNKADSNRIMDRIREKFLQHLTKQHSNNALTLAEQLLKQDDNGAIAYALARELIEELGGKLDYKVVRRNSFGLVSDLKITAEVWNIESVHDSEGGFVGWMKRVVASKIVAPTLP